MAVAGLVGVEPSGCKKSRHGWVDTSVLGGVVVSAHYEPVVIFQEHHVQPDGDTIVPIPIGTQITIECIVGNDLARKEGCTMMDAGDSSGLGVWQI